MLRYILFVAVLLTVLSANTQIRATTDMGITVYLFEDGTWSSKKTKSTLQPKSMSTDKKDNNATSCKSMTTITSTTDENLNVDVSFEKITNSETAILTLKPTEAGVNIDKDTPFKIVFSDGDKITLKNDSQYQDNVYTVYFDKKYHPLSSLELLQTKKITSIEFTINGFKIKEKLTTTTAQELLQNFNCN